MSDSFRYGNKKEINYEQFVQKMKNVQTSTNADLWKLFGVFDRDKNGKIENTTKELEVKSLFNFIKNYAGEDNVLDDSEIEKMLKDPQIASQSENKEGIIGALKEFFNNFGTDSVEIKRENETITVSKLENDGSFLAENFIKKVYKNEKGEEVTVVRDKNGRITETVKKSENESVTTIYNTPSVHVYDNFKDQNQLQLAQVMVKNGEEYFVLYDENGNTVTHAANNDSISKLLKHLGFENIEQLYQLNPKLKNPKHVLKVGDPITVPGHRDVTAPEIQNQGSIAGETQQYVKAYNEKVQREFLENLENFRKDNFSKMNKEVFDTLNKVKGFELTNENTQMYMKISLLPEVSQKKLVNDIKSRVEKGEKPDSIKEFYLNTPFVSVDGKNLTTINLFDGPTIELPSFSNPATMHIGNFIKNCDTELLFNETENQTKNFSVKTFFQKVLGLDITKGEGKVLYEQFIKINDPLVMMDINAMFANIARRTSSNYKQLYTKAQKELTDSYKQTIIGQGISDALNANKPLSQTEARRMFISVIQSMTAPKGQHVRTNYDSFINDHKDFYLRKFATEMVAFLYNRNGEVAQQTSKSKSILNPVGKLTLGFLAPRYSKDAQSIHALMTSDCYMGNKKLESTIKGYDTSYPGYDREKVKKCWEIMQNPNATEEQKMKALGDAFGHNLVHSAENLSSVCNFADGVTDIILLMYGTSIIGKGLQKIISFIPRAGSVVVPTEAMITGSKGMQWTQRLTSVGISSATFSIYDSAKFAVDYYSSDMYTSNNISFGEGITSAAVHSAIFGGFASVWGQAVTGNVLKWLFKSPQGLEAAQETMRLMTNQFKNTSKMSGKQVLSAFQGAQAKAVSTAGKEIVGFGSEVIGFSTYELLQKAYNGQLEDASLTAILSGQLQTLLSFKAVGKILFMHKAGKLPQDAIKIDSSKDVSIEPVKKDGVTQYKVTYPDGKTVTVPDMQSVVAVCNRHYEDISIYEPLDKVLDSEKKLELDDGISVTKDENGYSVEFANGEKVTAKNLREVMAQAQAKYQLIQYKDKLQTDGVCELPNGQKITLDRKTGEFLTTLTSGTKIYADNIEQLLQNASETQLCENIEASLAEQDGKMFLDEKTFLEKKGENDYELKIVLDNGSVVDITGKTIKEVMSKANTVKQFVDLFKTDKAQEDNVSQEQKPIFGIDETVIVEQESRILGYADPAQFECTKDGVIQILELFNERISSLSHAANYKVYNQFHIDNILKLFEKDPEFVMGLLKEQLQVKVGKHISDYILSPQQIQVLMQMREDYPDIYDKLPIRDEQTGEIRNGLTDFSSARQFFIAYNKNPELTMELVNQRYKDGKELRFRFFDFKELNQAVQNIDSNPLLREALDAKVVDTKGNEFYAHTFKDIRDGLLIDFAGSKEKALMQLKTNDGKYNLFSHEDIQMLIKRDIDVLIEELKDPQKAENAKKELMIILADLKLDAAVSQRVKALYDTEANRFIKEHIPDDAYAVDIGELYVDGTYEVRALTKDGIQTTRFYYKPELFHSAELIANEEVISQDEHSTTVRTEFADGRVIIDKFEKDTYDVYGKSVSYVTKQTRTEYDKDGEPVYEEVITPSKLVAGEMDITSADRVNGRVSTAQTQMFGQKIPLIQSHKKLTSPNGVTTETFVTQEEGCRKSSYVIKDADNNVILNVERQHFQVDENNYISFVNGQKYDIKFESGKITVVKEGVNGESSETITIDTKTIDPRLINLFKQLPGDFLFVYKKAGITSVTVSSTANKNGAYYSPNDRSIVVSKEMLNAPFVLSHELGHAMDELLLGELSNDEVLREIFDKELSAYRNRVSDAEGRIIDYFSTKIHYSGNNLMEVVAEVNAILSGFRTSDSPLFMRGLKLMQNFPETIKYLSDKLAAAKDMEAAEPQNQNTGVRLGIIGNMPESEAITVYDELEVEVSNLKTKEDAFIVLEGLNEHRAELSQEQYTQLETKIKEFITDNDHKLSPEAIQHKGLELEPWEQKSARLEIERRIRVAALEKMKVSEFSPLGARLDSMIDTLDVKNESDVARFKELLASNGLADFEREYLQTLLDNRLNPPTVKNYKPEQIAAEAQHLVRHYKLARDGARTEGEKTPASIVYQTHKIGLRNLGRSSQRVKSDTSTYDKLFNYMNEHKKDGATLIDALKDVRDEFGSRSVIEAGDYSDKPNVKLWLDAANEEGITPEKRRERLIQAAREAALYQSEELFLTLQDQMIQQAAMPNGLKGVRMVNYASADGVPVLSETQLWELHRLAEELGLDNDHIQIIELKEVLYPNGEIQVQAKDIFNKKVMDSGEYTTHSQKSGYTAFQMNFETQNGDWIEFQCRDVYTDEFGEAEHLIYDTLTGKDIIGRIPELKPIYDQLLEVLDENHLRKDVCKKYRQEYLKDYYTYCRAKSLGIDIGEPQLQEYAKRFGEELGIPDLKLDPRLEAKNLMALHDIAEQVRKEKIGKFEAVNLYHKQVMLSRGDASAEAYEQAVTDFVKELAELSNEKISEADFKDCSQQDLLAKIKAFEFLKKEIIDEDKERTSVLSIVHNITEENFASTIEMYRYLKEAKLLGNNIGDYLSTAVWVRPESVQAAIEFLEAVKNDTDFMQTAPLEVEFLIQDASPADIRHRTELYDILHRLAGVDSRDMYQTLEHIQAAYEPIMEVYYKVWGDKGLTQIEKEQFLKSLPFTQTEPKLIAENYEYLIQIKDSLPHEMHNVLYALSNAHPEYKQQVIKNYKSGDYSLANLGYCAYVDSAQRKYGPSTKQSDYVNQNSIRYFIDNCKKFGFTEEELANCSVEKLGAIKMYCAYCEETKKTISEKDKQIILSNNLEKRNALLQLMSIDYREKIILCSDEEFDALSDKIMRRRLSFLYHGLNEEDIDNLLNVSDERYSKIDRLYYGASRAHISKEQFVLLMTLSDEGMDNAIKRWNHLETERLTIDQLRTLLEMPYEEFEQKATNYIDRTIGNDIDPEAYREEVRAMLDGSYTLDMSAYNESRAKKAADRAKQDKNKIVVPFDSSTAIIPTSRDDRATVVKDSEQLIKELQAKGEVSISIPIQGDFHPKGDETKGRIEETRQLGEFSTGITLHYGEGRNWDNSRFARDMLQNFYDGNGNTLEGVDIEIKYENGRYKVKISGKGIYDYKQVFKLGKNEHTSKDAGKYGEGLKVMFATLLDSRGATYVRHSSGDWIVNLTSEQGAESSSRTRVFGDLQRAETRQEGATVEFDTTDEGLVQEILKAKDYFYSPQNPDFQNLDYENEYFGIKLLPKGQKGNIYVIQRYEVDSSQGGLDNTIDGATLVFKVMPDDTEIATLGNNRYTEFSLQTGRNRIPLTDYEIETLVKRYAMTIPANDLIRIIGSMEYTYLYKQDKKEDLPGRILRGLCSAALSRNIKIDFGHDNYVAIDDFTSAEDIKFAQTLGKTVVSASMSFVGVQTLNEYLSNAKKDVFPKSELTEVQANKIKLIDEAVKLFMENLDLSNMDLVTPEEASNPRYVYEKPARDKGSFEAAEAITKDGRSLGMWVDNNYLNREYLDLFDYVATWLHEISHKVGGDGDKVFNDRLQRVVQMVSQMCERDPAFRTKLRVLNEEFKKLNEGNVSSQIGNIFGFGRKTERPEEFNSEEFRAQIEQSLSWLTEDPEISSESNYKPTFLDYLANQKDKFDRKVEQYQRRFANWVVRMSEKLEDATANRPDDSPVRIFVSDRKAEPTPIRKSGRVKNDKEFEFKPTEPTSEPKTVPTTEQKHYEEELNKILENGGAGVIEMPPLADREPKIEFSGIRDVDRARFEAGETVESQMTLNYNSSNAWSLAQIARDMFQNLYDGHRGTLDGVKIDIKYEDGKYKIKILGQSEYDYFHIENIGASGEDNLNDGTRGGGFGEGAKMVPLHLLYGKYVDKFTYASGDWKIDFTRQKDAQGNELPVDEGYMMMTSGVNETRVSGNYIEFETADAQLVQAILAARNYFYHSENPDFKGFDIETKDIGIKILPPKEKGNLYYNQRYSVKGDNGNDRADFDKTVSGLEIVFKRTLSKDELAKAYLSKDCDRLGLSKNDVTKIAGILSESMTNEELIDAITKLQRYWIYDYAPASYESKSFEQYFLHGLVSQAIHRGLSFTGLDGLKIVCVDDVKYDQAKAEELLRRGYIIADNIMHYVGFPMINEVFDKATRIEPIESSQITLHEQQKILLLEEALGISKSDAKNGFQAAIVPFDSSKYQGDVEFYTREVEGFDLQLPYLAIDRNFLRNNDFQTCYNALISQLRRAKSESEASFGYKLTDLIRYQLRELSLPKNAERLRLIEERYREIE